MKDYCLELVAKQANLTAKYNALREYVQAYVLKIMQEAGVLNTCAFVGGTALRFLYDLPRFSEDLDFSSVKSGGSTFVDLVHKLKRELALAGYDVGATYSHDKIVYSAFVKFGGLLFETGLSAHKDERFSVKVEIDTRPPRGAVVVTKITNKFFPLSFLTYDLPSLFAGKIHAVLNRKYAKGRDYYDIAWYLSRYRDLRPNVAFLTAALEQTGWKKEAVTEENWRSVLSAQMKKADWTVVNRDVINFLERPEDLKVFTKDNVLRLVEGL